VFHFSFGKGFEDRFVLYLLKDVVAFDIYRMGELATPLFEAPGSFAPV
jgi:hypothetical protein